MTDDENNCEIVSEAVEEAPYDEGPSCSFLRCSPKEKTPPDYADTLEESSADDGEGFGSGSDQLQVSNQIFTWQNENGNWFLRWSLDRRCEEDFIALCYEGKMF